MTNIIFCGYPSFDKLRTVKDKLRTVKNKLRTVKDKDEWTN